MGIQYVVCYVRHDSGWSSSQLAELLALAKRTDASYFEHLVPHGFFAVFTSDQKGKASSEEFRSAVVSGKDALGAEISLGVGTGPLMMELDSAGRARSRPLGIVINEAMLAAANVQHRR